MLSAKWQPSCLGHNVLSEIWQIQKDGIIQTSPVVAIHRSLKDPPTWLKVATTLEKPPTHYGNKDLGPHWLR